MRIPCSMSFHSVIQRGKPWKHAKFQEPSVIYVPLISDKKVRFGLPVRLRIGDHGTHGASGCPLANSALAHVRFAPESDIKCDIMECLLHPQKQTFVATTAKANITSDYQLP